MSRKAPDHRPPRPVAQGVIQRREEGAEIGLPERVWWIVEVEVPTRQNTSLSYTLGNECDTPGKALDVLIKWAKDRGLDVHIEGKPFNAYRSA